jgi:hypothetical protein
MPITNRTASVRTSPDAAASLDACPVLITLIRSGAMDVQLPKYVVWSTRAPLRVITIHVILKKDTGLRKLSWKNIFHENDCCEIQKSENRMVCIQIWHNLLRKAMDQKELFCRWWRRHLTAEKILLTYPLFDRISTICNQRVQRSIDALCCHNPPSIVTILIVQRG